MAKPGRYGFGYVDAVGTSLHDVRIKEKTVMNLAVLPVTNRNRMYLIHNILSYLKPLVCAFSERAIQRAERAGTSSSVNCGHHTMMSLRLAFSERAKNKYLPFKGEARGSFLFLLFITLLLSSCSDKDITPDEPNNGGTTDETTYLSFNINIPVMSRAEAVDNDFEEHEADVSNLQVLLYYNTSDTNQDKLIANCQGNDILFVKGKENNSDATYNVRIPVNESQADILRTKSFKIAVLANWSASVADNSDIDDIHFQNDAIPAGNLNSFLAPDDNQKLGYYSTWAKPQINDKSFQTDPDKWIKDNWTTKSFGDYTDLWKEWNNSNCFGQWDELKNEVEFDTDGLHFVKDDNSSITAEGIVLPKVTTVPASLRNTNVLSFVAPASGSLYITTTSATAPQLNVKLHNTNTGRQSVKYNSTKEGVQKFDVDLPADAQRVYIYNTNDNPVTISKIEYIQGSYLAKTQYQAVTPKEQRIPMYGVETFSALGDWVKGTSYEISNFDDATGNPGNVVHLLRSVAKIVLNLPSNLHAHHVYLRDANMTAYGETNDVSSRTLDIWPYGHVDHTTATPLECEWFNIQRHGPFWNNTNNYANFATDLEWYYKNWTSIGDTESDKYPHVMNPRLVKTDFVQFIYTGTTTVDNVECDRYVLYMGDQFTDDPSDITASGIATAYPVVPHIEFRVKNEKFDDPFDNLDDDNCYRIYFTPGGKAEEAEYPTFTMKDSKYDNWENSYENNAGYLQEHWPIIRNHVYNVNVEDAEERMLSVEIKVLAWARREIHVTW